MIVKSSLMGSGSKMAKARVEIGSLHVDVLKSKITIKGLAVADKTREFKNLFSLDEAVVDYMFMPLLEKKYIIDNITVVNLAAGTDRKTSGFLKPAEIKKIEKDEADYKTSLLRRAQASVEKSAGNEIKKMPVSKVTDIKDIKKLDLKTLFKKEDLASYKAVTAAEAGIRDEKIKADAALKAADLDKKISETKESVNKIKTVKVSSVADIPAAQAALKELDKIKNNSDSAVKAEIGRAHV